MAEPRTVGSTDTTKVKSWLDLASTNNNYNYNDDNDDKVLTSVLKQVRHAYILPPATSSHVSQFTKSLESYGGVTTDSICCDAIPTDCYSCKLHETVASDCPMQLQQCWADISDCQNTFESCYSKDLRESFKDSIKVKNSTSPNSNQDVYHCRRQCRWEWPHERSVSIPPYLRPIEEEPDNEDQLDSSPASWCQAVTSSTGARDFIVPIDSLQNDVISNPESNGASRDDCQQPISDRVLNDVNVKCTVDECVIYRNDENDVTSCDIIGESQSKQQRRLFYVVVASLTAFVACLTSMSPSCVICIVTIMSLIVHHVL